MNKFSRTICLFILVFICTNVLVWADEVFKGPYTTAQYKDYQALLQKGKKYEADDNLVLAMKTYMEAISTYPVIAEEAANCYSGLYKLVTYSNKPGHGQYKTEDDLIAGFNKLTDEVDRYLCDNAQFNIIFSSKLTTEYELDEYTSYTGSKPGFTVCIDLDWFYGSYLTTMDAMWDSGTQSWRPQRSKDFHRFGYDNPSSFYKHREVMDFAFDITDKNGKVIVPSEKISQWRPDPEWCTVDPTWTYAHERFYVIKDISGKAKDLWLSGSDEFIIRLKSCTITQPDKTVLSIDNSRFTINRGEVPPTAESLFNTRGFSSNIPKYARQRWEMEQTLLKYQSSPAADLVCLPGRIVGSEKYMKMIEPLYIFPVTEQVFKDYMGIPYDKKKDDSQIYQFKHAFNNKKRTADIYGFDAKLGKGEKFCYYESDYLKKNYQYTAADDVLFFLGMEARKFQPDLYLENPLSINYDKEQMIAIPGGTVTFNIGNSDPHTVSVEDFYISRYPKCYIDEKYNGDKVRIEKVDVPYAAWYCNKLSVQYGYQPCYSVEGSTDYTTWTIPDPERPDSTKHNIWIKDRTTLDCDFSANGFRIPTLDELLYLYYAGIKGDSAKYEENTEYATEISADAFGVKGLHNNNVILCWDYCIQKYNETDPLKFPLTWRDKIKIHHCFYKGKPYQDYGCNNLWVIRSTPKESARLVQKAKLQKFPNVTKNMVQQLVKDVPVEGGKVSFNKTKNIKMDSFRMGTTEVTQELYKMVMGENLSEKQGAHLPVTNISIFDACMFLNRLSTIMGYTPCYSMNGTTDVTQWIYDMHYENVYSQVTVTCNYDADGFRLPTSYEWIYAAYGKQGKKSGPYDNGKNITKAAWVKKTSGEKLHEVGLLEPNSLGLYDMAGNVWELCFESLDFFDNIKSKSDNPRCKTIDTDTFMIFGGSFTTEVEDNSMDFEDKNKGYDWLPWPRMQNNEVGFRFVRKAE